jgi:hypothetical protein
MISTESDPLSRPQHMRWIRHERCDNHHSPATNSGDTFRAGRCSALPAGAVPVVRFPPDDRDRSAQGGRPVVRASHSPPRSGASSYPPPRRGGPLDAVIPVATQDDAGAVVFMTRYGPIPDRIKQPDTPRRGDDRRRCDRHEEKAHAVPSSLVSRSSIFEFVGRRDHGRRGVRPSCARNRAVRAGAEFQSCPRSLVLSGRSSDQAQVLVPRTTGKQD